MTKIAASQSRARRVRVAIIGSGFAGLGVAVTLKRAGIDDLTIFERSDTIGGVWRDNNYPGAACDVQSYLYSFSFAPNSQWSQTFSPQNEILDYLTKVAADFGLSGHLQLNCPVSSAQWDKTANRWVLTTAAGEVTAEHLVVATGALADPVTPQVEGLSEFTGHSFHSSRWDHGLDLTGKRVAVLGTGASAIQFVPAIQPRVKQLTVFQRTAPWVMPRHDRPVGKLEKALLRWAPGTHALRRSQIYLMREVKLLAFRHPVMMQLGERTARKHLREQVRDPQLRAKLTPNYRLGCKRILISNDYLRALDTSNTEVVTSGIRQVTATGVVDNDGALHEVDAIIFGTGFKTDGLPLTDHIYDADGTSMAERWGDSPRAYLGTMVAGFPNAYLMHGPNIGLGHTSVITMFEAQARYIVESIRYGTAHGIAAIEPTAAAQARFTETVDRLTEGSVWTSGGCSSWYLDATGRNSNLWPGATFDYHRRTWRFRPQDHLTHGVSAPVDAQGVLA